MLGEVFGSDLAPDGHIVRNCLWRWGHGFFKERCDGMLVVDPLEHFAGETWNADDSRGED